MPSVYSHPIILANNTDCAVEAQHPPSEGCLTDLDENTALAMPPLEGT